VGRKVSVKLEADVNQFTREVGGRAVGSVKSLTSEMDKASKAGKLDTVAHSAAGLGLGLVGVAGMAVKMSADFDKSMSAVKAATHAGGAEMEQLRQAALAAGKSSQFSATQAADGITELAKAGVHTADIMGGGLKGALDLAAAGQVSVSEAAETAASAMTQFKLSGAQVPHIADLLAAAAGKAQGSVHDMGYALSQSGLVASQFGLSIEDTTGVLAEFANAGLIGSDAGISFKTMMLAMANPVGKTKEKMDELGISFYDAQGQFIGIAGVARVLQDRLRGLTAEQRNQALAQIFGNDAIRAASILYADGADGVKKWAKSVNDSGYASKTAAALTDNLAGDLERLKGSLETMAIEAGTGANSALRDLVKVANGAVDVFSALPGGMQQTIVLMSGMSGGALLAMSGFIKLRGVTADFMTELRDVGPTGVRVADGLGSIAKVAGRLTLVGVAVGGVFEGFKLFGDWVQSKHQPIKANIDDLTTSIKDFAATGQVTGELASKYGTNLQKIGQAVAGVTKGMADLKQAQADVASGLSDPSVYANVNFVNPQFKQQITDLDKALTQLVASGGANQARIFLQQLAGSGRITAERFQELIGLLPSYTQATKGAAQANTGLAKGFGTASANAKALTSGLQSAIDAGQTMTDVWNELNGALANSDKANLDAARAIDAVKKSITDNGKSVDASGHKYDLHGKAVKFSSDQLRVNSEKALENRTAIAAATKAAAAAAQAKYEETGSVKAANTVYNGYLGQLRRTLTQSGLTKKEVDRLINAYGKMPDSVLTKVSITGDQAVATKLRALNIMQNALKKGVSVSTSAARALAGDSKAAKDRGVFAEGGYTGPGSKYEPAGVVHAGEYVFSAAATANLGVPQLDQMHQSAMTPGYAGGGLVTSWPFPTTASMTRIPSKAEALNAVMPAFSGGGGATLDFIVNAVHSRFPGMRLISGFRPGAHTLNGSLSYHAMHRAADWPASHDLAVWWNQHYMRQTKEFISPWNDLNIHNGQRHSYTGAIYRQHSGANAHDHIAMAGGGVINEPVFGFGASGRSYSFGERGTETVTPGGPGSGNVTLVLNATFSGPVGSRMELDNWLVSSIDRLKRRVRV
jgi:TP901 family phage tail tape measure protein